MRDHAGQGALHHKELGYVGNNGTDDTDYLTSIQARGASGSGYFRGGATSGTSYADFSEAHDHYTSYSQGSAGGSYTVRAGDSLAGIAAQLWGDAGLWYKLAQANGMTGDGALVEGQTLTVPAGVAKSSNTASTFRPYDPSDAVGDVSGQGVQPKPKGNECGVFGQILLVAIAIAVTLVLKAPVTSFFTTAFTGSAAAGSAAAVAAATAGSIVGAAATGAIASAVSQGVGVATGIQDKFSWSGVALAGISAGLTQGIGIDEIAGSAFLGKVASGAIASAVTQGIGVATGLQSKFDWAGVAAAGVGAGVGQALGGAFAKLGKVGASLAVNTTGGLINAATRSLVNGSDFGDNLIAALPDIIGQTIGGLVGDQLNAGKRQIAEARSNLANLKTADARDAAMRAGLSPDSVAAISPKDIPRDLAKQFLADIDLIRNGNEAGGGAYVDTTDQATALLARYSSNPSLAAQLTSLFRPQVSYALDATDSGSTIPQVVTGTSIVPELLAQTPDGIAEKADNYATNVAGYVQDHPLIGYGLSTLDVALMIAGGPVRAGVGVVYRKAVEKGQDAAVSYLAGKAVKGGYNDDGAQKVSRGYLVLGGLAVAGTAAALSLVKFLSGRVGGGAAKSVSFETKQAAREALDGPLGIAANRFFRDASKNAQDFRISDLGRGSKRFEFFSPARNPGFGKRYVQEVDSAGIRVREFKETLGPNGLIETKWIFGESP